MIFSFVSPLIFTNYHASTALGMIRETRNADIVSVVHYHAFFDDSIITGVLFSVHTIFTFVAKKHTFHAKFFHFVVI
jgi:uncharacterized NAD-dependent epimerase/dehydratase family protein